MRVAPKVNKKYAMDDVSLVDKISKIWDDWYDDHGQEVVDFIKAAKRRKPSKK